MSLKQVKVGILDDYQNLSFPYIKDLPSHLSINVFRDTILPSVALDQLVTRLEPYDVLVTMRERTPITRDVVEKLPNLKILLTTGLRNRGLDLDALKEKGVVVAGTPNVPLPTGVPSDFATTVQHTWALILSLTNNVPRDHNLIPAGHWSNATPLNTYLGGKTLGVLGLGKLGAGTARIALAFGLKVIAWSPHLDQQRADQAAKEAGLAPGSFKAVSKDELFSSSDILSVHIVLSDSTRGIVGASDLKKLRKSAFVVNTSRGPLIDEKALLEIVQEGRIKGVALDVFDIEPLPADSPWRRADWGQKGTSQVVYTPHTGYSFDEQLHGMWESTKSNLERISRGEDLQWKFAL